MARSLCNKLDYNFPSHDPDWDLDARNIIEYFTDIPRFVAVVRPSLGSSTSMSSPHALLSILNLRRNRRNRSNQSNFATLGLTTQILPRVNK